MLRLVRTFVLALASAACTSVLAIPDRRLDSEAAPSGSADAGIEAGACIAGPAALRLCTEEELRRNDATAFDARRTIRLPFSSDRQPYEPNCMTIRAGQTVTWRGEMIDHPLEPRGGSSPNNPIPSIARDVTTVEVTFPCPGDFNFGCGRHGEAMSGTIRVLP